MKTMTRAAINAHPQIVPVLAVWREAREVRDRIELDRRYGRVAVENARRVADEAFKAYDTAVAALLAS